MSDPSPIVRRLTPAGAGAVAVLRLEGPSSLLDEEPRLFRASNGRPVAEQPVDRVCYGEWGIQSPESIVICRTGLSDTEIHCHGGRAAVSRIMSDLESRGCATGKSSFANRGGAGLIAEECREAVTHATTVQTADILLQQMEVFPAEIDQLADLTPDQQRQSIESLLSWANFGLHLTQPWRVVLCGRPNVGKSSLINALVGYSRSIVFDQPGTTRDVVTVETALDGWPIEFSDTAGLREEAAELETAGIQRARIRLETADLRVVLIDVSQPPTDADKELLTAWGDGVIVAHKSDLEDVWRDESPPSAIPVSSVTGQGLDLLIDTITRRLVPRVPEPMTALPVTQRQVDALEKTLESLIDEGDVLGELTTLCGNY